MTARVLWLAAVLGALAPGGALAQETVPVATRDLARGEVLAESDVEYRAASSRRAGEVGRVGWVTRRVIRAGEELRYPAVQRPEMVRAGEEVAVRWRSEGVSISVSGVSASGAGVGETVWVRVGTGWRVEGVVLGPAVVEIQSPGRAK